MVSFDAKEETKELAAWVATVSKGEAPLFLREHVEPRKERETQVLVARADRIFGVDHLRTALYHAKKAMAEGRNASDSIALETLLYASGERQLSSALRKMIVDDETTQVVIAKLTEGAFEPEDSWRAIQDKPRKPTRAELMSFGITEKELATVGNRDPVELILEKVAAVDVLKK